MKSIIKTVSMSALAALIAVSMAACDTGGGTGGGGGGNVPLPTHSVGATMAFSNHQVWERNYQTIYLSEVHFKYEGSARVAPLVMVPNPEENGEPIFLYAIGYGAIVNGILHFNVEQLTDELFLPPGYLDLLFEEWVYAEETEEYPEPLEINPPNVRGNVLTLLTDNFELLSLEQFSASGSSLTGKFVQFIYAEEAVTVKAPERQRPGDNLYEALDLSLAAGWNMVIKSETYTTEGRSVFSMRVTHFFEGFKWALADPYGPNKTIDLLHRVFETEAP